MKEFSKYLTEIEVSEITGISKSCLQQHRWLRKGLPYIKIGRSVRYIRNLTSWPTWTNSRFKQNPFKKRKPIAEVDSATGLRF